MLSTCRVRGTQQYDSGNIGSTKDDAKASAWRP